MRRINGFIAVVLFAALTVLVGVQVLNRFVLHLPLIWSEEVARFLFFWVVMLGAALSVRNRRHFVLDVTRGWRPAGRRARALFEAFPDLCILGFALLLVLQGWGYAREGAFRTATNSHITMIFVYAAIPMFAVLTAVYAARNLVEDVRARAERAAPPPAAE